MKVLRLSATFLICIACATTAPGTALAQSFGSWGGGSGGSFGGGSFGGSSGGGSSGGRVGLFGGSNGGPIRNMLSRVGDRLHGGGSSGGSSGGLFHGRLSGGGSNGGSSGGSWGGRSYAGSSGGSSSAYVGGSSGGSTGYSSGWSSAYTGGSSGGSVGSASGAYYDSYSSGPVYSSPTIIDNGMVAPGYSVQPGVSSVPVDNTYYQTSPVVSPQNIGPTPSPAESQKPPVPPSETEGGTSDTSVSADSVVLTINLPDDALVYVNDRATRSTGSQRSFVARRLDAGKPYRFEVRAVLFDADGEKVLNQVVTLRGGQAHDLAFDFDKNVPVTTTVAVDVPEDAKISLAGVETNESGTTRVFSTDTLESGKSWKNYTVVATIVRDGKTLTSEKTLDVLAGQVHRIKFDFNDSETTRVAQR